MSRSFTSVASSLLEIAGIDPTFKASVLSALNRERRELNSLVGIAPEAHKVRAASITYTAFKKLSELCFQLYPEIAEPSLDDISNQLVSIISNLSLDEAYQIRLSEYAKLWTDASVEELTLMQNQQEENIIKDAAELLSLRAKIQSMRPQDYYDKNLFNEELQEKQLQLEVLEKRSKLAEEVVLKCKGILIERA
jgi:hypothetical protein